MLYTVRYVHKVSSRPEPGDTEEADLPSSVVELGDVASVSRMLRTAKLIGKGQQIREMRRERIAGTDDTKLVCFPRASIWHALIIEPHRPNPETTQETAP